MSLIQFLRILVARRWIILGTLLVCLVTTGIVSLFIPRVYEGKARVELNVIKPDPVTGEAISPNFMRAYTLTQRELIRDERTLGVVADRLGWTENPVYAEAYQKQTGGSGVSYRSWLAQLLAEKTDAKLLEGSNILEIVYLGAKPDESRLVAGLIRDTYLDTSLNFRKNEARRNADWYQSQLELAQRALAAAESTKTKFEQENGIVSTEGGPALDEQQLGSTMAGASNARATVAQAGMAAVSTATAGESIRAQIAEVDQQIATAAQQLGPNHPQMIALKGQRRALEQQLSSAQAAAAAAARMAVSAASGGASQMESALEAQKKRFLAAGDKYDKLAQLQREVVQRRAQYDKLAERTTQLRLESNTTDSGIRSIGEAVASNSPAGLAWPLVLLMGAAFGAVVGLVGALLIELLARRVRGAEDMEALVPAPVLGLISNEEPRGGWLRRFLKPKDFDAAPALNDNLGAEAAE